MATIHFVLQGKGGVGKSMISSILYQTISALGNKVSAYDTDPANHTLFGYKEFNVTRLELRSVDGNIDARKFDLLLEGLAEAPHDAHVVVDNGASSFIALGAYMQANDMLETLLELGHTVYFHTIITGGQAIGDTVEGFIELARCFPQSSLIVWLNPFFGAVEMDGKSFTDFKCFKEYGKNVTAVIELPIGSKDLIGKDLEQLFAKRQSFEVGINSSHNNLAVRSRLKKYWKQILSYVEQSNICLVKDKQSP